jgi:hypothetical protein
MIEFTFTHCLWFHKDLCNFSQANNKKKKPPEII